MRGTEIPDQHAADDFVDVKFITARYDISQPTAWRWVKTNHLPAPVRLGPNCTRWRMSALLEFERARAEIAQ